MRWSQAQGPMPTIMPAWQWEDFARQSCLWPCHIANLPTWNINACCGLHWDKFSAARVIWKLCLIGAGLKSRTGCASGLMLQQLQAHAMRLTGCGPVVQASCRRRWSCAWRRRTPTQRATARPAATSSARWRGARAWRYPPSWQPGQRHRGHTRRHLCAARQRRQLMWRGALDLGSFAVTLETSNLLDFHRHAPLPWLIG